MGKKEANISDISIKKQLANNQLGETKSMKQIGGMRMTQIDNQYFFTVLSTALLTRAPPGERVVHMLMPEQVNLGTSCFPL